MPGSAWRWRLVTWLLYRALAWAPDGNAAIDLEDTLREWNWRRIGGNP